MDVQNFNFNSPEFNRDPFPVYARMRELGPVLRTKMPMVGKCWITTTYEATNAVLRDKDSFVTDSKNAGVARLPFFRWWMPKVVKLMMKNMLTMDEPDHRPTERLQMYAWMRLVSVLIECGVLMGPAPGNANGQRSDPPHSDKDPLDSEFGHSFTQPPKSNASFISVETESRVEPPELKLPPQAPPDPELFGGRIRSLVKNAGVSATHLAGGGSDPLGITDISVRASIFTPTPLKKIPFLIVSPSWADWIPAKTGLASPPNSTVDAMP